MIASAAWPAGAHASITELTAGLTAGSQPTDITTGPDGNLWFTQRAGVGRIGRVTPSGSITEYVGGITSGFSAGQQPSHITSGPDGALWATEDGTTGQIVRLDPATGTVTEYATGITPNRQPTGITTGPDGNLWFTERGGAGAIGRITPGGLITEYTTGLTSASAPTDIAPGDDGALWFTENSDPGRIGRIDPSTGAITEPGSGLTANGGPSHIVSTDGGKELFFTEERNPGRIGSFKTGGSIEEFTSGLTANSAPGAIAQGGDGALWFTEGASPGRLGRLWPDSGSITEFAGGLVPGLTTDAAPTGVTQGPDGNVWFTESSFPGAIGHITVPPGADIDTPAPLADAGTVRFRAQVRPNSQPTTYRFEYGPGFASATDATPAGSDADAQDVSADVSGLALDTAQQVRVVATNPSGTTVSEIKAFLLTSTGTVINEKPSAGSDEGSSTLAPVAAAPATAPDSPAAGDAEAEAVSHPPVLGQSIVVAPVEGDVLIKPPGASSFRPLTAGVRVRIGSLLDTRRGTVELVSARNRTGARQTGTFWGGVFQVRQVRSLAGVTDIVLRGSDFGGCGSGAGAGAARASSLARESGGSHVVRRLWGKDHHSRFRTHGRDSVATVRGTVWSTVDRCDGTLTSVKQGMVSVLDLHSNRSVLLSAGRSYLARHQR